MEIDETRRGDYQLPMVSAYRGYGLGCGMVRDGRERGIEWDHGIRGTEHGVWLLLSLNHDKNSTESKTR